MFSASKIPMNTQIEELVTRLLDEGVSSRDIVRNTKLACRLWEFRRAMQILKAREIGCNTIVDGTCFTEPGIQA